ncbi:MAG: hypothetical protein V1767_06035 [Chloroflexota bacterium]
MTKELKTRGVNTAVQESLAKLDVDAVGVVSLAECKGTKLEESALALLPEARSVVVFAMEIFPEILNLTSPGRAAGQASLNDFLDRHAEYLNGRLTRAAYDVTKASHKAGLKALPLPAVGCPTDVRFLEAVISYKHAAQAAGLGYIGRSSLLITPRFGPRVRLAACLTEVQLEPTKIEISGTCGNCRVCINKCPAEAITVPQGEAAYSINKFACSAFRTASGGCSECLRLCPASK